jgi:hypothetical protein
MKRLYIIMAIILILLLIYILFFVFLNDIIEFIIGGK